MNLEIYFVRSKEIIQFCYTSFMEIFDDSIDSDNIIEPDLERLSPVLSIDITYMIVIAILLGFFFLNSLNIKNK